MKIIINADDFGLNEVVTSKTEEMIDSGVVTSATIMANGECLDEVARFVRSHPNVSFGIHLCLDEYDSLTHNPVLCEHGITDKDGHFIKGGIFNCNSFDNTLKAAIHDELCAQIERLLSLGIDISHADSHHLVHTRIIKLQSLFIMILKEYGIKKVRVGEEYSLIDFAKTRICCNKKKKGELKLVQKKCDTESHGMIARAFGFLKAFFERRVMNQRYKREFITTDEFLYYSSFMKTALNKGGRWQNTTIELMCHPGHPSEDYQEEVRCIEKDFLKEIIEYQSISYLDL